jgi:hypothetical protein
MHTLVPEALKKGKVKNGKAESLNFACDWIFVKTCQTDLENKDIQ